MTRHSNRLLFVFGLAAFSGVSDAYAGTIQSCPTPERAPTVRSSCLDLNGDHQCGASDLSLNDLKQYYCEFDTQGSSFFPGSARVAKWDLRNVPYYYRLPDGSRVPTDAAFVYGDSLRFRNTDAVALMGNGSLVLNKVPKVLPSAGRRQTSVLFKSEYGDVEIADRVRLPSNQSVRVVAPQGSIYAGRNFSVDAGNGVAQFSFRNEAIFERAKIYANTITVGPLLYAASGTEFGWASLPDGYFYDQPRVRAYFGPGSTIMARPKTFSSIQYPGFVGIGADNISLNQTRVNAHAVWFITAGHELTNIELNDTRFFGLKPQDPYSGMNFSTPQLEVNGTTCYISGSFVEVENNDQPFAFPVCGAQ